MKETEEIFNLELNSDEMFFVHLGISRLIEKEEEYLESIEEKIDNLECGDLYRSKLAYLVKIKVSTEKDLETLKKLRKRLGVLYAYRKETND